MEQAYVCPNCKAEIILEEEGISACCFCGTEVKLNQTKEKTDGGFYVRDVARAIRETCTCRSCSRTMILPQGRAGKPERCLYCGDTDLNVQSQEMQEPLPSIKIPFAVTKEEAQKEFLAALRKNKGIKLGYSSAKTLDLITPAYVPCFFFDYHVFANAILSVIPYIKEFRDKTFGDKFFGWLLVNDMSFERGSNRAQPYAKSVGGEMAWKDIPICACSAISRDRFIQISPFARKGHGKEPTEEEKKVGEQAIILGVDRPAEEILDLLKRMIRGFVKECMITTNLDNFEISSYVDQTEYFPAVGQLVYVPVWLLKIRKKNQFFAWYINAISATSSRAENEDVIELPLPTESTSLQSMNKKRIKKFSREDFEDPDRTINYRTYMVDTVASAITADMTLNEMAADKSLLHLENATRRNLKQISVPVVTQAYQAEAEEEVRKSKLEPLPSAPVHLPTRHSALYTMKEEAMERSLGKGPRLPSKPMDRRVGDEEYYDNLDNSHEYVAKEVGLADLPEYDPNGPCPFKKL